MTDQLRKIIELLNSKDQEECKLGLSLCAHMDCNFPEVNEAIASALLTVMSPESKNQMEKDILHMMMKGSFGEYFPSDLHKNLKTLNDETRDTKDNRAD